MPTKTNPIGAVLVPLSFNGRKIRNWKTICVSLPSQLNGGLNAPSGKIQIGFANYRILSTFSYSPDVYLENVQSKGLN